MSETNIQNIFTADEKALEQFGASLARSLKPATKVYLYGELGSGKTTLCRGLLRELGYTDTVKSPTFSLLETYEFGELHIAHMDLYRLTEPSEMFGYGLLDYFDDGHAVLLEWPERGGALIPSPDITIRLTYEDEGRRVVVTHAN